MMEADAVPRARGPMRSVLPAVVLSSLIACGSGAPSTSADPDAGADAAVVEPPTFQLASPTIDLQPHTEVTFCYYFRTPNTEPLAIRRWASTMSTGGHHMIAFFTASDLQVPGTVTTSKCGFAAYTAHPTWVFAAQTPTAEAVLPTDDGTGAGVAISVKPSQSGFLLMHLVNAGDTVLHAHVELAAYAYAAGARTTQAAPFVTYDNSIYLSPGSAVTPTLASVTAECAVPAGAKFYVATMQTHKQATAATIRDGKGGGLAFMAAGWEHPGEQRWLAPFYTFASGKLAYQCDYSNPNAYTIIAGDNLATDETCMAIGYYFPAASPAGTYCLNGKIM